MEGSASFTPSDVAQVLGAVSTLGAALVAAITAIFAWRSSLAAQEAVREARLARKSEYTPRLVLEKDVLDLHLQWPHPDSLNGEPVMLSRKHWKSKDLEVPTFSLTNYGGSPALELEIVFEFDDPNPELNLPDIFKEIGFSISDGIGSDFQPDFKVLEISRNGGGVGMPLYRKWTVDLPNCAPGQTRQIEFPTGLLSRAFVRGLQYLQNREMQPLILTVKINFHTVELEKEDVQFRFHMFPFYYGGTNPLVVNGHFWELPTHPRTESQRVV